MTFFAGHGHFPAAMENQHVQENDLTETRGTFEEETAGQSNTVFPTFSAMDAIGSFHDTFLETDSHCDMCADEENQSKLRSGCENLESRRQSKSNLNFEQDDRSVSSICSRECAWDYVDFDDRSKDYPQNLSAEYREQRDEKSQQRIPGGSLTDKRYPDIPRNDIETNMASMHDLLRRDTEGRSESAFDNNYVKSYDTYPLRWKRTEKDKTVSRPVLGVLVSGSVRTIKSKKDNKRKVKKRFHSASKCLVMDVAELFNNRLDSSEFGVKENRSMQRYPQRTQFTCGDLYGRNNNDFDRTISTRETRTLRRRSSRPREFYATQLADIVEISGSDANVLDLQADIKYNNSNDLGYLHETEYCRSSHSLRSDDFVQSCIFCAESEKAADDQKYRDLVDYKLPMKRREQLDSSSTITSRKCSPSKASLFVEVGESCAGFSDLTYPSSVSVLREERAGTIENVDRTRNRSKHESIAYPVRIISKAILGGHGGKCNPECTTLPRNFKGKSRKEYFESSNRHSDVDKMPKSKSIETDRQSVKDRGKHVVEKETSRSTIASSLLESEKSKNDLSDHDWQSKRTRDDYITTAVTKEKGLSCRKSLEEMNMRSSIAGQLKMRMTNKMSQTRNNVHIKVSGGSRESEHSFWTVLQNGKVFSQVQDAWKSLVRNTVTGINHIFKGATKSKRSTVGPEIKTSKTFLSECSGLSIEEICLYGCKANNTVAEKRKKETQTSDTIFGKKSQEKIKVDAASDAIAISEIEENYSEVQDEVLEEDAYTSVHADPPEFTNIPETPSVNYCENPCCPLTRSRILEEPEYGHSCTYCPHADFHENQNNKECVRTSVHSCINVGGEDLYYQSERNVVSNCANCEYSQYRCRGGADSDNNRRRNLNPLDDNQREGVGTFCTSTSIENMEDEEQSVECDSCSLSGNDQAADCGVRFGFQAMHGEEENITRNNINMVPAEDKMKVLSAYNDTSEKAESQVNKEDGNQANNSFLEVQKFHDSQMNDNNHLLVDVNQVVRKDQITFSTQPNTEDTLLSSKVSKQPAKRKPKPSPAARTEQYLSTFVRGSNQNQAPLKRNLPPARTRERSSSLTRSKTNSQSSNDSKDTARGKESVSKARKSTDSRLSRSSKSWKQAGRDVYSQTVERRLILCTDVENTEVTFAVDMLCFCKKDSDKIDEIRDAADTVDNASKTDNVNIILSSASVSSAAEKRKHSPPPSSQSKRRRPDQSINAHSLTKYFYSSPINDENTNGTKMKRSASPSRFEQRSREASLQPVSDDRSREDEEIAENSLAADVTTPFIIENREQLPETQEMSETLGTETDDFTEVTENEEQDMQLHILEDFTGSDLQSNDVQSKVETEQSVELQDEDILLASSEEADLPTLPDELEINTTVKEIPELPAGTEFVYGTDMGYREREDIARISESSLDKSRISDSDVKIDGYIAERSASITPVHEEIRYSMEEAYAGSSRTANVAHNTLIEFSEVIGEGHKSGSVTSTSATKDSFSPDSSAVFLKGSMCLISAEVETFSKVLARILSEFATEDGKKRILMSVRVETRADYEDAPRADTREAESRPAETSNDGFTAETTASKTALMRETLNPNEDRGKNSEG